jgi:DNA-binding NarL/FixJ family response regulator
MGENLANPNAGIESVRPTVFLADEHEVVRHGLRHLLERAGVEVVGDSGTATDSLRRIPALHPTVVVLEQHFADGSGYDLCQDLHRIDPMIGSIILTATHTDLSLLRAIRVGARGYLTKGISSAEFSGAVYTVAAGKSLFAPDVHDRAIARQAQLSAHDPRMEALSGQERRVLLLVAEGLTNRQIAHQMFLAEKTVRNYVSLMLAKLGMERRTQAALYFSRVPNAAEMTPQVALT